MASWKNRIVGYEDADPTTLKANSRNWRLHPVSQKRAFKQVADDIGWVDDVIVNLRTSKEWGDQQGTKTLVDGHLRVELALEQGERTVPVKHVDLSPDEEALVLVTFDPLGAMAKMDMNRLDSLVEDTKKGHEELMKAVHCLGGGKDDSTPKIKSLEYQILVSCTGEKDQAMKMRELESGGYECKPLTL